MVLEVARDTGFDDAPAGLPVLSTGEQDAIITELYPRIDPLNLTRNDWLYLPDAQKKAPLIDLEMKSYDPKHSAKLVELFPEGFMYPISPIEERVFASESRVKNSANEEVLGSDRVVLEGHLHLGNTSIEEAIAGLQEFGRIQSEGGFWPTQHDIGGYELSRLTAYEIKAEVGKLQKREEIRLASLQELSVLLKKSGIPMVEADEIELERLRGVVDERNAGKQAMLDRARFEGYRQMMDLMASQSSGQRVH